VRKIRVSGHDVSVNRKEFQALSRIRLREARALAKLGMHDGAYYLAGYSVECAIKACIAKATQRHDFPDKKKADLSYTHNLTGMLGVAKLQDALLKKLNAMLTFETVGISYNCGLSTVATAPTKPKRPKSSWKPWAIESMEYSDG
jgi:hypothetical protein